MKKRWNGFVALCFVLCLLLAGSMPAAWAADDVQQVMVITVDDAVEPGLASYLERNIASAREKQVDLLILELDTPGGRVGCGPGH